jgi:hypothetical protein
LAGSAGKWELRKPLFINGRRNSVGFGWAVQPLEATGGGESLAPEAILADLTLAKQMLQNLRTKKFESRPQRYLWSTTLNCPFIIGMRIACEILRLQGSEYYY